MASSQAERSCCKSAVKMQKSQESVGKTLHGHKACTLHHQDQAKAHEIETLAGSPRVPDRLNIGCFVTERRRATGFTSPSYVHSAYCLQKQKATRKDARATQTARPKVHALPTHLCLSFQLHCCRLFWRFLHLYSSNWLVPCFAICNGKG